MEARPPRTLADLAEEATLVVRGEVAAVVTARTGRVVLATVRVSSTIRGRPQSERIVVAQDLPFPSDEPAFHEGNEALLFLSDIPSHSLWKEARDKGARYVPAGGGEGVKELGPGALDRAAAFLERHRALAGTGAGEGGTGATLVRFLIDSLGDPTVDVQEAAAWSLGRLDEDARRSLTRADPGEIAALLGSPGISPRARALLVRAAAGSGAFDGVISAAVVDDPAVRLAALASPGSAGIAPRLTHPALRACLRDDDPEVRLRALALAPGFTFGGEGPGAAVGEMALGDPSPVVRARAVEVLAEARGAGSNDILERALDDESPLVVYAAARGLERSRGAGAAREVGRLLASPIEKARAIGVLVLAAMADERASALLREGAASHPDPKTRDLCRKALEGGAPGAIGSLDALLTGGPEGPSEP